MDAEALQAFLAKPLDAVIATNRQGKGPQLSPVWFLWDGEAFLFGTQKTSAKYANIMRDPNISVIVNDPATTCVTACGRAEVIGPERYPKLWDAILEKYMKYMPEDQREQIAAWGKAREHSERVFIALKPEKIIAQATFLGFLANNNGR